MQPKRLQDLVTHVLDDGKAQDMKVIDVKKLTTITDYMIICTGTSLRHLQAMSDRIVEAVKKEGLLPWGIDGRAMSEWVVVDLGSVMVHLMTQEMRDLYALEKLWQPSIQTETKTKTKKKTKTKSKSPASKSKKKK